MFATKNTTGLHMGMTPDQVDAVLGPPAFTSPSFGRPERIYKTKDGKIMCVFEDDKLVEIHNDVP